MFLMPVVPWNVVILLAQEQDPLLDVIMFPVLLLALGIWECPVLSIMYMYVAHSTVPMCSVYLHISVCYVWAWLSIIFLHTHA